MASFNDDSISLTSIKNQGRLPDSAESMGKAILEWVQLFEPIDVTVIEPSSVDAVDVVHI